MFMWQPSYSEAPKVCWNVVPLSAGISRPSRQGTTMAPFSVSVTDTASSSTRRSPRFSPSYRRTTDRPSSASSKTTAAPLDATNRTVFGPAVSCRNSPSNPLEAPGLADPVVGHRTSAALSSSDHRPVVASISTRNDGLSRRSDSAGAAAARNWVRRVARATRVAVSCLVVFMGSRLEPRGDLDVGHYGSRPTRTCRCAIALAPVCSTRSTRTR